MVRLVHSMSWIMLFVVLLMVMPTGQAQAYLDPGSGSLIIQMVIGGILAVLVAVRLYWSRIINFFTGRKPEVPSDDSNLPGDDVQ